MNVRPIACFAAVLAAALLAFPLTAGAQQPAQVASRPSARAAGSPGSPLRIAARHAQPEHRHGHLGQSQRHLSLSRLRHVGRARRRQRAARPAGDRQGRLPERHGRAAPARRRSLHHAIQHHDLSEEDRRDGPQHREPARLHHPALQRGDAHPRRPRHQQREGARRQEGQFQRRRQRHAVLHPPDLRAARHQGDGNQRRPGRRLPDGQVGRDRGHRADRRQADRLVRASSSSSPA